MRGFAVILIPAAFILGSCHPAAAPVSVSNHPVTVNDVPVKSPLRDLTWTTTDGIQTSLKNLQGKAVILDFWATYCPPCRDEIPHLNALQAKYGQSGLKVIGLNSGGEEDKPKIPAFLKETAIEYEMAFPDEDLTATVFDGDDRIPQTLIINRKGQIVKKIVGFSDQIKMELDAAVETALASN